MKCGEKIKQRNYTISQMSIICDISYENLHKILTGKRKDISVSTLLKICENSGISILDILEVATEKEKKIEISLKIDGRQYEFIPKETK